MRRKSGLFVFPIRNNYRAYDGGVTLLKHDDIYLKGIFAHAYLRDHAPIFAMEHQCFVQFPKSKVIDLIW
jgi:hypothetical protein